MSGLDNLKTRVNYLGGKDAISRMRVAKLRSLRSALQNSYQSAVIQRYWDKKEFKCLVNPDVLKPDYDNKIFSVENEAGFRPGDVFYWPANNTYWLVYLQELTETAYFRASIRRCRYKLVINDSDYYVYIQGPTETDIKFEQKSGLTWNGLNHSITMYVAKTDDSVNFFQRFTQVELDGQQWRVQGVDSMSIEGLIEVTLGEFFNDPIKDLQQTPVAVPVDTTVPHISGEAFVKPYDTVAYTAVLMSGGTWSVSNDKVKILNSNETTANIEVTTGRSGSFDITYHKADGDVTLTVTIESL